MEWTQIFIPIVVSFAITVSVMPLFIGYFQMNWSNFWWVGFLLCLSK